MIGVFKKKENSVDPYVIIEQLQKNIPLNAENALNMLKLLNEFNYLQKDYDNIYSYQVSEEHQFIPYNQKEKKIQIALQRQQLTKEYINKCKEIILANEQQIGYSK